MFNEILEIYLLPAAILVGAYLIGYAIAWLAFRMIRGYGRRQDIPLLTSINRNLRRPARFLIPLFIAWMVVPIVGFNEEIAAVVNKVFQILVYLGGAWLVIECTDVVGDLVRNQYRIDVEDNLQERKVLTQVQYIKRVVGVVVTTIAVALILMQFPRVRELGGALLTSAGIAGIVIGIAAQQPISNLLAGFQIAFSQPMRIDDVVIVEGEWGRIEEINLTYVVVRIWDQRRLVVPLTYFIQKPFQNWTRTSADILGTVYIYTDYRLPLEPVRQELTRLLEASKLWDGRVNVLQITDSTEKTMEVRALMSAANSSKAWDLRCHVREKLITFIQQHYPESLPRMRVETPDHKIEDYGGNGEPPMRETKGLSDSKETSVDQPSK